MFDRMEVEDNRQRLIDHLSYEDTKIGRESITVCTVGLGNKLVYGDETGMPLCPRQPYHSFGLAYGMWSFYVDKICHENDKNDGSNPRQRAIHMSLWLQEFWKELDENQNP